VDDTDKTPAPSSRGIFADKTTSDKHLNIKPFNFSTIQPSDSAMSAGRPAT